VGTSRRRFLQFVAASPLFARIAHAEETEGADPVDWAPRDCVERQKIETRRE
jgi:hypothetical protein